MPEPHRPKMLIPSNASNNIVNQELVFMFVVKCGVNYEFKAVNINDETNQVTINSGIMSARTCNGNPDNERVIRIPYTFTTVGTFYIEITDRPTAGNPTTTIGGIISIVESFAGKTTNTNPVSSGKPIVQNFFIN